MVKVLRPLRSICHCKSFFPLVLRRVVLTLDANMDVVLGLLPYVASIVVGLREGV